MAETNDTYRERLDARLDRLSLLSDEDCRRALAYVAVNDGAAFDDALDRLADLALIIALAGCGGTPQTAEPISVDESTPTPKATKKASEKPSPTTPDFTHKIGETVAFTSNMPPGTEFRVVVTDAQVLDVPNSIKTKRSNEVFGVLAKSCLDASRKPIGFSPSPWTARGDDGEVYAPTFFPADMVPDGAVYELSKLAPGTCMKGWITFEVPETDKIEAVAYTPVAKPGYVEWPVK